MRILYLMLEDFVWGACFLAGAVCEIFKMLKGEQK